MKSQEVIADDVLSDLRRGTADLHQSIERVMPKFEDIDADRYRQILEKFYGFYEPFEKPLLEMWPHRTRDLQMSLRQRVPLLKKDLGYFHAAAELENLPRCKSLPRYQTWAELFGGLYVLEGSTLGGQLITAQLQKQGFPKEVCHFFGGHGAQTGKMWQSFLAQLKTQVVSEVERQQAVKAAQETFLKLESWLADRG